METEARVMRTQEAIHADWEVVKEWAKAKFTKDRMAEVGVLAATLMATGFLGTLLCKGIQTYSMSGF